MMPDVLCMSHVLKYKKSLRGEVPGWRGADEVAKSLQEAACSGTDPPIPFSLPHTRAISGSKRGAACSVLIACEPKCCVDDHLKLETSCLLALPHPAHLLAYIATSTEAETEFACVIME